MEPPGLVRPPQVLHLHPPKRRLVAALVALLRAVLQLVARRLRVGLVDLQLAIVQVNRSYFEYIVIKVVMNQI